MRLLAISILIAVSGPAQAYEATRAWGTGSIAGSGSASANMHRTESETAQIETIGRDVVSMYRSNYSCGTCVTYTIDGHHNSIGGNEVSSTNSGSVTANGNFNR